MPICPDNAPELIAATADIERLQASWPVEVALLNGRKSCYYALPLLLIEAFPALRPIDVHPLMIFSRLLAGAVLLHDHLVDHEETPRAVSSLRIMAMQAEAYHTAHGIFPPTARFWDRLRRDFSDYASALLEEQQFSAGERALCDFTEPLALRIAIGKHGLARSIVAGLAELAHDDTSYAALTHMLDETHKAFQLIDDLRDWKDDLRRGLPSLVLARADARPIAQLTESEQRDAITQTAREIYYGGHAAHVLDLAISTLAAAGAHRARFPELAWFTRIDAFRQHCESLRSDLARIVDDNLRRARTREAPGDRAMEPA